MYKQSLIYDKVQSTIRADIKRKAENMINNERTGEDKFYGDI
ncbi:hypothetical protein GCM10011346_34450 [Oceanobacillus neutriphilus]|uniref:Uncharacterized protein n=1 Tax=Oceanobacillus neutriphilus TaxID=531815 RepID=A0ABQ2NYE4_9BACI|nr:hypothetical protein GCM10011346_34450 [Oceanobacillus neutriphilus]